MSTQSLNSYLILSYHDTLLSKNKLKKFILLNFLLIKLNDTYRLSFITLSLKDTKKKHKNVFLQSPFHFKTVKTHLYIPTYTYSLKFNTTPSVLDQIKHSYHTTLTMVGELHSTELLSCINYKF